MILSLALIVANVLIFILPYTVNFSGPYASSFQNFLMMGWKDNAEIRDGEYYRLFTSNFLHADLTHLFFNMFSLYNIGPIVNSIYGNLGFTLIYLLSGIGSSYSSFQFNPQPSVGASGAIFGLVGALLAYAIFENHGSLIANIFVIIVINAAIAFFNPRIDNWGHVGGFVCGFILGAILLLAGPSELVAAE